MNRAVIFSSMLALFLFPQSACVARSTETNNEEASTQASSQDLSIHFIKKTFHRLKKPRKGMILNQSIRSKKYDLVKKNITKVQKYLTPLKGQRKKEQDLLKLLYDQILWIDDFTLAPLKYFSSPYYAESFFKEHNNLIGTQTPKKERKKND